MSASLMSIGGAIFDTSSRCVDLVNAKAASGAMQRQNSNDEGGEVRIQAFGEGLAYDSP